MTDEDLLDRVIIEYQSAADSGSPPDRAELLARYPHLVGSLNAYFADHDRLEQITRPLRHVAETASIATASWHDSDHPLSIPGYEIHTCLGIGGMGVVYLATELALKRRVALKWILTHPDPSRRELFRREAETVAALQHPNIVQIFAIGEVDQVPYLVLEYLDGGSLADRLNRDRVLPAIEATRLVAILARAVAHAHRRGILHRDLKPANVLLSADGLVKVTDFGLAKRLDSDDGLTSPGVILGTAGYMAPEQAQGQPADTSSDIYALGAILFECLAGRPPFTGKTPLEVILKACRDEPRFPDDPISSIERQLRDVALRCLEREPTHRPKSADTLAEELEQILTSEQQKTPRRLVWVVALLIGLMALIAVMWFWPGHQNDLAPSPRIVTRAEMLGQITRDRAEHPRRYYLTLGWLINDPSFTDSDRHEFHQLLTRVGQSLNMSLVLLDDEGAVYALDSPASWDNADWQVLLGQDPYALQFETDMVPPLARADWFVRRLAATRPDSVEGLTTWAKRLANRPVDRETAAAELGLTDSDRIVELILTQPQLVEKFKLGPLIEGGRVDRQTWESTTYGVSAFQTLAGESGVGVPILLE